MEQVNKLDMNTFRCPICEIRMERYDKEVVCPICEIRMERYDKEVVCPKCGFASPILFVMHKVKE